MSDRISQPYAIPPGQPISVPFYYASNFSIQATFNDFTIILHDTIPISDGNGVDGNLELRRPVAIIKLSPHSAKELSFLLHEAVQKYEKLNSSEINNQTSAADSVE